MTLLSAPIAECIEEVQKVHDIHDRVAVEVRIHAAGRARRGLALAGAEGVDVIQEVQDIQLKVAVHVRRTGHDERADHALPSAGVLDLPDVPEGRIVVRVGRDIEVVPPASVGAVGAVGVAAGADAWRVAGAGPNSDGSPLCLFQASQISTNDIEKKLLQHLKRRMETEMAQLGRARTLVRPNGKPQERVFTAPAYLGRYGPGFLDDVLSAATAFYTGALEAAMTRS